VDIFGEVRKEGHVRKYGGMTLQDLIYLSGGLKQSAEYGRLEISSIVDIDSAKRGLKPTRNLIKSYAIQSNLELDTAASKIILKPYDQIFVRKNPTFELQENVQILGLVKYAGYYPRLNKYEKLSSYIERAGGVLENANIGGAILYRKKVDLFREKLLYKPKLDSTGKVIKDSTIAGLEEPVSIDLYKALKYKDSKNDIILQENDVVFVPEINPFITIKGVVQSPLKITFESEHTALSYYIDKAGGYGIRPWRKRVYVTYPNGKSRRTRNFLFIHSYPSVEEGSTITVPQKPENKEMNAIITTTVSTAITLIITYLVLKIK
jgi:protein involved in polysaccharide export with SLBB domain